MDEDGAGLPLVGAEEVRGELLDGGRVARGRSVQGVRAVAGYMKVKINLEFYFKYLHIMEILMSSHFEHTDRYSDLQTH